MRLFILAVLPLLLMACSAVMSEPLPTSADDPKLGEISKKLDDDDKKLLIGYLMRRELAKSFGSAPLLDGAKTVGEALDAQKQWASNLSAEQQKAETLKAEVQQQRKAIAEQINKTITVAFIDARFLPSSFEAGRYDDYETLTFAIKNVGSKDIKAVKGEAVFIDTFGDEFVRVPMQIEDKIAAGQSKTIELGMEINKFMDEHKKVMSLDKEKKFRFEPDQIVFEDGSTVKAPSSLH